MENSYVDFANPGTGDFANPGTGEEALALETGGFGPIIEINLDI